VHIDLFYDLHEICRGFGDAHDTCCALSAKETLIKFSFSEIELCHQKKGILWVFATLYQVLVR